MSCPSLEELAGQLADLIVDSRRLVVFTGAGHSTESGIPDFRSPGGIWTKLSPEDFTYQKFVSSLETRRNTWNMLQEGLMTAAQPNPAHHAVAKLEKLGKLDCVITQNVDGLHQAAGNSPDRVFELHGNMQRAICLDCGKYYPIQELQARVEGGEAVPDCEACMGMLKPDAVFFGESLPPDVLEEAARRSMDCDLFIVIGSSLVVYPAALMPQYAVDDGAKLAIVNLTPTHMDRHANVVIHGKAGEVMPLVMENLSGRFGK